MSVRIENKGDVIFAYISGELDHHSAADIRRQLDKAILETMPKECIIDYSGLTFMDSSGIGLIMGRINTVSEYGGKLTVTGASGYIERVIKIAGLSKYLGGK